MAKQTFTSGQVLTAAQVNALQANDYNQTVSTKTASYTLVASDVGTKVVMNSASATTITVNTSLFTAGDTLTILNIGAGLCTITAGTATVSSTGSLALAQYGGGTLYFTSAGVSVFQANGVTSLAKLGQVVQATLSTQASTTSTSYVSTGQTATITPSSTSSKVLAFVAGSVGATAGTDAYYTIFRGDTTTGTNLGSASGFANFYHSGSGGGGAIAAMDYLDSPATASAQVYTVAYKKSGGGTIYWSAANSTSTIILVEVLA